MGDLDQCEVTIEKKACVHVLDDSSTCFAVLLQYCIW